MKARSDATVTGRVSGNFRDLLFLIPAGQELLVTEIVGKQKEKAR